MIIEDIECEDRSVAVTGIEPGDMYMAKRNTGWHLLECAFVKNGAVYPKTNAYPYDLCECFKVKE